MVIIINLGQFLKKNINWFVVKKGNVDASEEIILDVNKMAKGYDYYAIGGSEICPDNKIVTFGEDRVSRKQNTIYLKILETGKIFDDVIPSTTGIIT
jgi:oligopeptidase B